VKLQHWCSVTLAGVSLTDFGLAIPSPFTSLSLNNSEITSMTSFTLVVTVGSDASKKVNVSAFEALLYSAAQAASSYPNASGIPISFAFGWLDQLGRVNSYISYQGFTLKFNVSTSGMYMKYEIMGYAQLAIQSHMPVLHIPEFCGYAQPSAVLEALLYATKADVYYDFDIDHCDSPTIIQFSAQDMSLIQIIKGNLDGTDSYDRWAGFERIAKTYNGTRTASGLDRYKAKCLSQILNNASLTPIETFLKEFTTDTAPQCSSFSAWIDEPTATSRGAIHFKSDAGLLTSHSEETLQYGTSNTNILSLSGSYNGVAYNMTDMNFKSVGFTLDASGNSIINDEHVVNSWSATLPDVFQTANIINDVNAIASQFSGDFNVTIPGNLTKYEIAQPISLLIMSGNTLSPATGVYSIMSVSHNIGDRFTTSLKLQRLTLGTANQVASARNIYVNGESGYDMNSFNTTKNIRSVSDIHFDYTYPNMTNIF